MSRQSSGIIGIIETEAYRIYKEIKDNYESRVLAAERFLASQKLKLTASLNKRANAVLKQYGASTVNIQINFVEESPEKLVSSWHTEINVNTNPYTRSAAKSLRAIKAVRDKEIHKVSLIVTQTTRSFNLFGKTPEVVAAVQRLIGICGSKPRPSGRLEFSNKIE